MFFIVNKVDGAGLYEYHYSLALSMLKSNISLMLLFIVWLLYARKCGAFVNSCLHKENYSFMYVFNSIKTTKRFLLFLLVNLLTMLPLLLYAAFVLFVGCKEEYYEADLKVLLYIFILLTAITLWNLGTLQRENVINKKALPFFKTNGSYYKILFRFIISKQTILLVSIKVFTCCMLYLIARNNGGSNYDISFPFLFFNFGVLANGVMIYRTRTFEETYLSFYRTMPVLLGNRLKNYVYVSFLLLIPELCTIIFIAPGYLHITDAISFAFCAYALVLLMFTMSFVKNFDKREYSVALFILFFIEYLFLLFKVLSLLGPFLLIAACFCLFAFYYRFEKNITD